MNEVVLHLDYETRSVCDLKAHGAYVYADDPTTDVVLASYAFDDEEVLNWFPGDAVPDRLISHIQSGRRVYAHNANFELLICNNVARPKYGWPALSPDQMVCTQAMAYAMAIPGSLANAAAAVGIENQKDLEGHKLMLSMCVPKDFQDGKPVWEEDKDKVARLAAYGRQDVEVERELGKRLVQLSTPEMWVWVLDQKINERGIHVDLKSVDNAIRLVDQEKNRLDNEMREVTESKVNTCTAVSQLKTWMADEGVIVEGIAKSEVTELLSDEGLPSKVRAALLLRKEAAKSSTAKLRAMRDRASKDSRVRGAHQYHGAATGRWAGRGIQIQNFPRGKHGKSDIEAIFNGINGTDPSGYLNLLYGSPLGVVSDSLRSFICAPKGNVLRWVDFSSIEARVLAWLAGERMVLKIYEEGGDPYVHAAAGIYKIPIDKVTKEQRQIGKVATLALGYQGGKRAFQNMAKVYGVEIKTAVADDIKRAWRDNNPNIVNYWWGLERAAMSAIKHKGETVVAGRVMGRQVKFKVSGSFMWVQLPSERVLCYPYPKIEPVSFTYPDSGKVTTKDGITYMGEGPVSKKWERLSIYGGMFAENITQAVARDLLVEAMQRLEKASYNVVFHVHDEICVETEKRFGSLHEIERIAEIVPLWAKDLPIKAEGGEGERYCK